MGQLSTFPTVPIKARESKDRAQIAGMDLPLLLWARPSMAPSLCPPICSVGGLCFEVSPLPPSTVCRRHRKHCSPSPGVHQKHRGRVSPRRQLELGGRRMSVRKAPDSVERAFNECLLCARCYSKPFLFIGSLCPTRAHTR